MIGAAWPALALAVELTEIGQRIDPRLGVSASSVQRWDEAFTDGHAPTDATIQVWRDATTAKAAVEAGYSIVYSPAQGYRRGVRGAAGAR